MSAERTSSGTSFPSAATARRRSISAMKYWDSSMRDVNDCSYESGLPPKAAIVSSVHRLNSGRSEAGIPSISQMPPMATALA